MTRYLPRAVFVSGLNIAEDQILENIRANCARLTLPRVSVKKAVVVGGGPSLADHLDEIKAKHVRGFHVYALNGTSKYLKANGIQPNAQFIIDARPENISFLDPNDEDVTVFLGSQVDPSLFDALANHPKVHMVHVLAVDGAHEVIRQLNPGASILTSAPTVGLQALNLMHVLGYRIVHLYGYDSSNRDGAHHAYVQQLNEGQRNVEFVFRGKSYHAPGPMASQAEQFVLNYRKYTSQGMDLQVIGEGLLPDMYRFHEAIREQGSLEERETIKYQKMWSIREYRQHSPGELRFDTIVRELHLRAEDGIRIIDFGCGSGRLTQKLRDAGFDAVGVDFADNCLDPEVSIQLTVANLWHLPAETKGDCGICCDVMEHVPLDKVEDVLRNISAAIDDAVYFSISLRDDEFGRAIGETLHLTVRPHNWWVEQLERHWRFVRSPAEGEFIVEGSHE